MLAGCPAPVPQTACCGLDDTRPAPCCAYPRVEASASLNSGMSRSCSTPHSRSPRTASASAEPGALIGSGLQALATTAAERPRRRGMDPSRRLTCRAGGIGSCCLVRLRWDFGRQYGFCALALVACHSTPPASRTESASAAVAASAPKAAPAPEAAPAAPASAATPQGDASAAGGDPVEEVLTLAEARSIAPVLGRHLKTAPLEEVHGEWVRPLRQWQVGEPVASGDGSWLLPPWRVARVTREGVELTWTLDLGHESGVRTWYSAWVERAASGWRVQRVRVVRMRRAER